MNSFLLFVALVIFIMVVIANIYILVYFQHEDDKNLAIFPKIVVVSGLTLACVAVLLLPMDVANAATFGDLPMVLLWQIVYMAIAILCVFVIPFALFYYEAEDPESNSSQFWTALKYEAITVVVAFITLIIMYTFLGWVDIPIRGYESGTKDIDEEVSSSCPDECTGKSFIMTLGVTPPVYVMALIAFIGWFFFVLFGGIGLAALPLDLISDFQNRPKGIDLAEYADQKIKLNERANKLIEIGKNFEKEGRLQKQSRGNKKIFNKFKQAVFFLEKDWELLKIQYKQRGGNPLAYWFWLLVGIICSVLSIFWVIHICLFVFPETPVDGFLNNYFMALDGFFPLFGVITYCMFCFYLLWCVVKGCMKFGMRFFFLRIHPMRVGGTMMNSFLFNTSMILICSVSVVQFCATAFSTYARLTAIDMIFGVQVRNLRFLQFFFQNNVFLYALVGLFAFSTIFLLIFPKEKSAENSLEDD